MFSVVLALNERSLRANSTRKYCVLNYIYVFGSTNAHPLPSIFPPFSKKCLHIYIVEKANIFIDMQICFAVDRLKFSLNLHGINFKLLKARNTLTNNIICHTNITRNFVCAAQRRCIKTHHPMCRRTPTTGYGSPPGCDREPAVLISIKNDRR